MSLVGGHSGVPHIPASESRGYQDSYGEREQAEGVASNISISTFCILFKSASSRLYLTAVGKCETEKRPSVAIRTPTT